VGQLAKEVPGTVSQCRCRATLAVDRSSASAPAAREAAGVRSAWSQSFNHPPRDHADRATLGRRRRTRRPVFREARNREITSQQHLRNSHWGSTLSAKLRWKRKSARVVGSHRDCFKAAGNRLSGSLRFSAYGMFSLKGGLISDTGFHWSPYRAL
jgi:hypothetical protein